MVCEGWGCGVVGRKEDGLGLAEGERDACVQHFCLSLPCHLVWERLVVIHLITAVVVAFLEDTPPLYIHAFRLLYNSVSTTTYLPSPFIYSSVTASSLLHTSRVDVAIRSCHNTIIRQCYKRARNGVTHSLPIRPLAIRRTRFLHGLFEGENGGGTDGTAVVRRREEGVY